MTDQLFEFVPLYGVWVILAATFLSCLALPIPASFVMLAGGAFSASGDLSYLEVICGAWAGAVLGDQAGYLLGTTGGSRILTKVAQRPKGAALVAKARSNMERWGSISVFLTRWLFSPLGPYVNFLAGAGQFQWPRFAVWSMAGEAVWVSIYVVLGAAFAEQITQIADLVGNAIGLVTAGTATFLLGRAAFR